MKRIVIALGSIASLVVLAGCPMEPRERPDVACADVCKKRIVGCSEHECDRGCAFVLDRLVEHEQETVLSCIERSKKCTDGEWAECAAHVGAHIDGGPGVPEPLPTEY